VSGSGGLEELERRIRDYIWAHPGAREDLGRVARALGETEPFGGLTLEFIVAWDDLQITLHQRHLRN